jgi:KipI family sensor histidine kinase inhibitor
MDDMRIAAAGDAAMLVEFPPAIDPEISGRVIALGRAVRDRCGEMIRDVVVGYCSLTVYFDPLSLDPAWLEAEVRRTAEELPPAPVIDGALIDVPVCYGGDLGPDLADVAAAARCSEDEVIALHTGRSYRVYLVGFIPGFPYMAEVDPRIALPRRPSPRMKVPAGSVAIAAGQTGIYPSETPGGWHVIGRTRVKPYDPSRAAPFLFKAGDRVRFHRVERAAFDRAV